MRRWIAVFMLLVLPLQFAWAAAAPYCAHEAAAVAGKHPGHHQHVHQGGDVANAGDAGTGIGANHTDCASCHAGAAATLPQPTAELAAAPRDVLREPLAPRYRSHTPSGPERPDIVELNPTARFGGEVEFSVR
jgi:hypothetical protein